MEQVDQKKSLSQQLHDKASKISIGYDIEAHDKHYALLFLGPSLLILSVFCFLSDDQDDLDESLFDEQFGQADRVRRVAELY